jgi:predicted RecB family nuclease
MIRSFRCIFFPACGPSQSHRDTLPLITGIKHEDAKFLQFDIRITAAAE